MTVEEVDVLILGGGLCGLAAATQLGKHATVLDRADVAGGLVRSGQSGEWWFDDVLHLLYFWDKDTARLIGDMLGPDLGVCRPEAWVETPHGITRYPIQMHLGALPRELARQCVSDIEQLAQLKAGMSAPSNFAEYLELSFGSAMCDVFMFPYNRKMWKRPLESLGPTGFQWNISQPDLAEVRRGVEEPDRKSVAYNSDGHYPRPAAGAPIRGMEVLSRALAKRVTHLRTQHEIVSIDLENRCVEVRHGGENRSVRWRQACLSTIPLPAMLRLAGADTGASAPLVWNRVVMVDIAVRGARPTGTGQWRYYGDENIVFNRLIYQHEFDPLMAPADGWGLMAEITERAEDPIGDLNERVLRSVADARRVGALRESDEVVATRARVIDPAYVAFTLDAAKTAEAGRALLQSHGVTPLGRYGRWEYSSMAQVMRDGFSWGAAVAKRLGFQAQDEMRWDGEPMNGLDS